VPKRQTVVAKKKLNNIQAATEYTITVTPIQNPAE